MLSKSLVLLTASLTLVSVSAAPIQSSKHAPTHAQTTASLASKQPYGGASRGYNKQIHDMLTAPAPAHAKRGSAAMNYYAARRSAMNHYAALAARDDSGDGEDGEDCEGEGEGSTDPPTTEPSDPEEPCEGEGDDPSGGGQTDPEDPCPGEGDGGETSPGTDPEDDCEDDPQDPQDPQDPEDPDCEDEPEDPSTGTGTTPDPTPNNGSSGSCKKQYTVKEGDYCGKVASDNGIDIKDFYKWNPSLDSECMNLELGQAYCVKM